MAKKVTFAAHSVDASPLLLPAESVDTLLQSDGFNILRQHLAQHYAYGVCEQHSGAPAEDLHRWLIVRDVLHALLVPVVELFDKARTVAAYATQATRVEDLEYAFTGAARSAFVWLQCFLSSPAEEDWCYARGCPVCVVGHTLDSEFTLRLLYAACLLSDVHYPFTFEGPTLPSFMFFLDVLKNAIASDELYGNDFFELLQPKAAATRDGVEDLIHQCMELDAVLSQPVTPIEGASLSTPPTLVGPLGGNPGMKVKRGKVARQQLQLKAEEDQWMEQMLKVCYDNMQTVVVEGIAPTADTTMDEALKQTSTVVVTAIKTG